MSRLGLTFAGIDRARGRKQIEGPLATMAFADVYTSGYPRAQDLEVGEQSLNSLPYYCAIATSALEQASDAIACDNFAARCKAVATATEAMTSLFLELDGINRTFSIQDTGRLYESILRQLLNVNLNNNPETVREAAATIKRLHDASAHWNGGSAPSSKTAAYRPNS